MKKIKQGNPLDPSTMIGAQASNDQLEDSVLCGYRQERRRQALERRQAVKLNGELQEGYYVQPTVFQGHNKMRIFQEEIFGPASFRSPPSRTRTRRSPSPIDTLYGLGSGVWTRDINCAYRMGRGIQAGRVWTNCYHLYPAHAAFGGYKKSGIGRETHKMMLDHYQQTKNVLVSYSPKALGFF